MVPRNTLALLLVTAQWPHGPLSDSGGSETETHSHHGMNDIRIPVLNIRVKIYNEQRRLGMVGGEAFGSYEAFSAHNMLHKEGTRDVLPAEIHVHMKRLVPH